MIEKQKIVLGVTGSIAAYKACEILRQLKKRGAGVDVILTRSAARFVSALSFKALGAERVYTDESDLLSEPLTHIRITEKASLLLVAPATANIIAKSATGIADDLLSSVILASACPVVFAPAMNNRMWENPATQRNVNTILEDGKVLLGPVTGDLACGQGAKGRMMEPADIVQSLEDAFCPKLLENVRVLVTAGATFEPIDPVRGITNLSSGKQGFAIARACARAGARVTLIAGVTSQKTPPGVNRIDVKTGIEMFEAVKLRLPENEIFISVAAVADWRVVNTSEHKLKKAYTASPELEFAPNPDILAYAASVPNPPYCVGFAAETDDLIDNARAKVFTKHVPLIIANQVQDALGKDSNTVVFVTADGAKPVARASKDQIAQDLVEFIAGKLS